MRDRRTPFVTYLVGLTALVALTGCARPRATVVPPPPATYEERGTASWYGQAHQGRRTASGERYDVQQMTAAHRSLPFNTWILVENLDNGKTVEVRINDRGPFRDARILDLSHAAARVLGALGPGLIPIRLRVIGARPTRSSSSE